MKYARLFFIAFVFFFTVGLFVGWDEHCTNTTLAVQQRTIIHNFWIDNNPQHPFSYRCKGKIRYIFNEQTGPNGKYLGEPVSYNEPEKEGFSKDIERLFAGVTGLSLRELFVMATKRGGATEAAEEGAITLWETKKIIVVALGTVSGYYAGKWIFTDTDLPCDSPIILNALQTTPLWQSSMQMLAKELLGRAKILNGDNASSISDEINRIHNLSELADFPSDCNYNSWEVVSLNRSVNDTQYAVKLDDLRLAISTPYLLVANCAAKNPYKEQLYPQYKGFQITFFLHGEDINKTAHILRPGVGIFALPNISHMSHSTFIVCVFMLLTEALLFIGTWIYFWRRRALTARAKTEK
jgi:hypothetical protein